MFPPSMISSIEPVCVVSSKYAFNHPKSALAYIQAHAQENVPLVGLAKKYPNKNFLGIDIKGSRMWTGATQAQEESLRNVGFLRLRIEFIELAFVQGEVDEIWITFPDPQLKKRRAQKRLTHPLFLKRYNYLLQNEGVIHLKTDSQFLHGYTLGIVHGEGHVLEDAEHDLYNAKLMRENMEIRTHYEQIYLDKGIPITYCRFKLNY